MAQLGPVAVDGTSMSTHAAVSVAPEVAGELERIIDGRAVWAVFQP